MPELQGNLKNDDRTPIYFLRGKCVVAGERIKLLSWWLIFCSSITNVVIAIAINLLIKKKIVAKTQRLHDFKSLLSSANLKIQSDVYRLNVKERIIMSDKHVVFGGSWVQFSPGVQKFSFSRASMISPPSKLKMFTGSVCVLLTNVSLKLIKIKIKLIYATTSSWEKNKMAGEKWVTPTDFIFLFKIRVDPSPILFYFFILSGSIRPGLAVRVDPVRLLYLPS